MKFSLAKYFYRHKYLILISALAIILGHFFGSSLYRQAVVDQKQILINTASLAASSINLDELKSLNGSAEDAANPHYAKLSEQLVKMGSNVKSSGILWIYSMLAQNEQIVFSFDSLVPGDLGYGPPGGDDSIYQEPPQQLLAAIKTKRPQTTDRYQDEYGTYISAFVPILEPGSDELLAVIGVDMEYEHYIAQLRRVLIYPLASVLLSIVALFMVYAYFIRLSKSRENILTYLNTVQKEKTRMEVLLSVAGEPIFLCDRVGILTYLNQAALDVLECDSLDLIGKSVFEVMFSSSGKQNTITLLKDVSERLINQQQKVTLSSLDEGYELVCSVNEKALSVIMNLSPIVIGGKVEEIIGIFSDISQMMEADRIKSDFISLASHQLRTPLSKMRWTVEMLSDDKSVELAPSQLALIKSLDSINEQLISLTNSLLNISKFEMGHIPINPEHADLGTLARQAVVDLEEPISSKCIKLSIDIQGGIAQALVDTKLMIEVYKNLLGNAVKYTPKYGVVSLKIHQKDDKIISEICDTGLGIPEEEKGKIFERFYRAENVKRHETEGSGLGLYLVKAILKESYGQIGFESKENEGARFWFTLPAV